jgi:hypothetical protein
VTEEWRSVVGYEGRYEVSDLGRVKSVTRMQTLWHGGQRPLAERILKTPLNSWGRPQVTLHKDGVQTVWNVHTIVARAFLGAPPDGMEVCHCNGQRTDNRRCNLRYGTRKQNAADRTCHGTQTRGSKNSEAKLDEASIEVIRRRLKAGDLQRVIAADFGVSQTTVSRIKCRRNWAHV